MEKNKYLIILILFTCFSTSTTPPNNDNSDEQPTKKVKYCHPFPSVLSSTSLHTDKPLIGRLMHRLSDGPISIIIDYFLNDSDIQRFKRILFEGCCQNNSRLVLTALSRLQICHQLRPDQNYFSNIPRVVHNPNRLESQELILNPNFTPNLILTSVESRLINANKDPQYDDTQYLILAALLRRGANDNIQNYRMETPLRCYVKRKYPSKKILNLLYDNTDDEDKVVDPRSPNTTFIHVAAEYGGQEAIEFFYGQGVDINVQRFDGNTAKHIAACHKHPNIIHQLNALGALSNMRNKEGETPLITAAKFHADKPTLQALIDTGEGLNERNFEGRTPLHLSAQNDNNTQPLIDLGADINAKDLQGETPLFTALFFGKINQAKKLCKNGATHEKNINGEGTIHAAVKEVPRCRVKNYKRMVDYLKSEGRPVDEKDNEGNTPSHFIASRNALNGMPCFEDLQTGQSQFNNKGQTPLHCAAITRFSCKVKEIGKLEKNIDAQDNKGQTPMHYAAQRGNLQMVQVLRELKSKVAIKDFNDKTAADLATENNHPKVASWLKTQQD